MAAPKDIFIAILWTAFVFTCFQSYTLSAHISSGARQGRQATNLNVTTGLGCGTIRVLSNQTIQINSSNFNISNYSNKEACTYTFTANDCGLSVYCPCFNIAPSLGCLEDYLKITHLHFQDRFCGSSTPVGIYRATTDFLSIRFRTDYRVNAPGFLCYIRCTAVGQADPPPPSTVCPSNAVNVFGVPV